MTHVWRIVPVNDKFCNVLIFCIFWIASFLAMTTAYIVIARRNDEAIYKMQIISVLQMYVIERRKSCEERTNPLKTIILNKLTMYR